MKFLFLQPNDKVKWLILGRKQWGGVFFDGGGGSFYLLPAVLFLAVDLWRYSGKSFGEAAFYGNNLQKLKQRQCFAKRHAI